MDEEQGYEELELLEESVDEVRVLVIDERWQRVLPGVRAALERAEAGGTARWRSTPEESVERIRLNGPTGGSRHS